MTDRTTLLKEIDEVSFALNDVTLYLDTHPDCADAISYFNQMAPKREQLLKVWSFALIAEFITGCIVNLWLGWNVWDYSNLRFNLLGQTSLTFALLFLPICAFAIVFDDYIRYLFFNEEPPRYKFL